MMSVRGGKNALGGISIAGPGVGLGARVTVRVASGHRVLRAVLGARTVRLGSKCAVHAGRGARGKSVASAKSGAPSSGVSR